MRSVVAFLLLLVGVVMVPVATATWWAYDTVVPADGFVAALAPLATDPAVTGEVRGRLTTATTQRITEATGAAGDQVEPVVRLAAGRAVASPGFARAWRSSTRDVHSQLVGILSGPTSATGSGGEIGLQLAPLSGVVRDELASAGVPFADQLPTVQASVPLFRTRDLAHARTVFAFVRTWGPVLPFVTLGLLALGVLVARRRARALRTAALGSLVGIALLAMAVLVARASAAALPGDLPAPVAHAVVDTLAAGLWRDLLVVAVGAAVLLLVSLVVAGSARR